MNEDLLQEIPQKDLELLSNIYRRHQDKAPHVYSLLDTYITRKKKKSACDHLTFLGVNGDWLETGTFIAILQTASCDLFLFTLQKDHSVLQEALIQTKRIDWSRRLQWYALISEHVPIALNVIKHLNLPFAHNRRDTNFWVIKKEEALKFQIEIPNEVFIGKLDQSYVKLINDYWPHKYEGSHIYLSAFIEMNDGYGVFLKDDNALVSWMLKSHLGLLAILHTVPEHKRKGYGMLVTKILSKEIAMEGHNPAGCIAVGNSASEKMFKKLGFHCTDRYQDD